MHVESTLRAHVSHSLSCTAVLFRWTGQSDNNGATRISASVLQALDRSLAEGRLIGVVGPMGCGKTTLIMGILGQLVRGTSGEGQEDDVSLDGRDPSNDLNASRCSMINLDAMDLSSKNMGTSIAYASQKPWLQQGTILSAITFSDDANVVSSSAPVGGGLSRVEDDAKVAKELAWLHQVIDACGLRRDIDQFKLGLMHLVGDQGGSLSGKSLPVPPLCRYL